MTSNKIEDIFKKYKNKIKLVIHTAAQPSHDWAATNPYLDFNVNAFGTLNLLENTENIVKMRFYLYINK